VRALLDANVLIALAWPKHEHHARVAAWFTKQGKKDWATCALTQSALLRISMQSAFSARIISFQESQAVLALTLTQGKHTFLPLDYGFEALPRLCTGGIYGHRQITDAWLVCAAILNECKLVTLDTGVANLLATPAERAKHVHVLSLD
jgi:uncharacterized protein